MIGDTEKALYQRTLEIKERADAPYSTSSPSLLAKITRSTLNSVVPLAAAAARRRVDHDQVEVTRLVALRDAGAEACFSSRTTPSG